MACTEKGTISPSESPSTASNSFVQSSPLKAELGYWVFDSQAAFMEGISHLSTLSDEELKDLEEKHKVKSLHTTYFDVVQAMEDTAIATFQDYQGIVEEHASVMFMDDDSIHQMNLFSPSFAKVFNKEGLVKVGDYLLWGNNTKVIYFNLDDVGRLDAIKRMETSDEASGITVVPVTQVDYSGVRQVCRSGTKPEPISIVGGSNPSGSAITNTVLYDRTTTIDKNRSEVSCTATQWWFSNNVFITVSLYVKNQRRSGFWFGHKASVDVSCSFDLSSNHPNSIIGACSGFPGPVPNSCYTGFSVNNYNEDMPQDQSSEWAQDVISPFAGAPFTAPTLDPISGLTPSDPPYFWTQICAEATIVSDFKSGPNVDVSF